MSGEKRLRIRNSTAEFLIFTRQAGEKGIEVRVEDETVWLTQKLIGVLFEVTVPTVNEHLKNIISGGEVQADSAIRKFRTTASDGKRYLIAFYNLDAIIAVGFRVNSARAIQFRQWATGVLRDFAVRGYVLAKERLNVPVHLRRTLRGQAVKCNRVFCSDSVSPVIWTPMQVGDGDDAEDAGLDLEDVAVGEPVDKTSPCVL